jgi:hypothetical protein
MATARPPSAIAASAAAASVHRPASDHAAISSLAAMAASETHQHQQQQQPQQPQDGSHYGTLTDRLYNAELARRSVARAALHLGIDRVEGQALDCLGDALLDYLERVSLVLIVVFWWEFFRDCERIMCSSFGRSGTVGARLGAGLCHLI